MATQTNALYDKDQEWVANNGANAYITNELENLTVQQPFEGNEMVAMVKGSRLKIDNVGATFLHNPNSSSKFHLKNVLHCPNTYANLLSI
jgi:hypothetical protein